MPEDALDGDTEGRNREEKKENEENEEQGEISRREETGDSDANSDTARRKNNDSEMEASGEDLKNLRVKYELVDREEVKEEEEEEEEEEDQGDDDYDYSEGEDSWLNHDDYGESKDSWLKKVQKKRNEEEKDYVWLRKIDKESYLKVMAPQYLLLEVRSASALQVQQVRQAVSHLSRVWPWWGIGIRHRGQERIPWLCVAPSQRPGLQVSGSDDDEDEEELWDFVDQQQWRHTKVNEGMLSSVTLISHPRLSAAAAAVAAAPHAHRNQTKIPAAGNRNDSAGILTTTSIPSTSCTETAACNEVQMDDTPGLPHKVYLLLGIPRPFVDDTTAEVICHTLLTLFNDVLSGRIQEEYQPGNPGKEMAEAQRPSLESWVAERLEVRVEVKAEGTVSNVDPEIGCRQDEENEQDSRGYVQRTFDSITSHNFINRCKAERVSYVNGFATCVSSAAASFLAALAREQGEAGQQVVTRQRVCEHLHWPAPPMDWHDADPEEESPAEPSTRPPGVTITAPTGEDNALFWETARDVSQQRWRTPAGDRKEAALHIPHGLASEDEEDLPLQRYPTVSLRLCDIRRDEGSEYPVQRVGEVAGLGPHSLSPFRHFLITHTINLHLEEVTQVLSFSLHHSTLFLSPGMGKRFADEIENTLKNSLRRR